MVRTRIAILFCLIVAAAIGAPRSACAHAMSNGMPSIKLGESTLVVNGPWRFHTGDDLRWADSGFDDSGWESVDFEAPPGATDGDVGLPGYVSGWTAQGHAGYWGYAWYRIRLEVTPPAGRTLALLGPWATDSTYQMYVNGVLVGGVGNFSGRVPTAYGYHYPMLFSLPSGTAHGGDIAIAIRTWMGPWDANSPDAGGIHIAPVIGERDAITALYRLQWLKIFEGYVVDAVPGLLFFSMALTTLCVRRFDRSDPAWLWLALALVLSGLQRGNQAFFFWLRIETVRDFVYFIVVLVGSLNFAAWTMAWRNWFKADKPAWFPRGVAALTIVLMVAQILVRPWLFHVLFPPAAIRGLHDLITAVHLAFLMALIWIVQQGVRNRRREIWYAIPAVLAICVVLFASELSAVRVPGIWFPWGVGLSLSEIASVVFDTLLFAALLHRLWSYASRDSIREAVRVQSGLRSN
ncbi:MAG: glycoside hydrolase [Rhizomicrobium sp.]